MVHVVDSVELRCSIIIIVFSLIPALSIVESYRVCDVSHTHIGVTQLVIQLTYEVYHNVFDLSIAEKRKLFQVIIYYYRGVWMVQGSQTN